MHDDLAQAIDDLFPSLRERLESLIHIPSVSAVGYDPNNVRDSAEATAKMLLKAGLQDVRLLELPGAHPAVYGELPGPEGSPTVLLYAHHDVQPPGPPEEWTTDAFEPIERDGRLFGRGSCDDKSGIVMHVGAIEAHGGRLPVGVKVFVEGEEEIGSLHLQDFISSYRDLLDADVIVVADTANLETGTPCLTTSLRGLVDCVVEVRTLDNAIHSGLAGGVAPDALTAMSKLLATLHDEQGRVAVPGLVRRDAGTLKLQDWWRESFGVVEGVELIGDGTIESRIWMQPAIAILAIDAPPVADAINQLVPSARAKVSMRVAPGQDPKDAMAALVTYLEANAPWGARVTVTPGALGESFELDATGPAYEAFRSALSEAWGRDPIDIGIGGSIPFVAAFSSQFPMAAIVLFGVADNQSKPHAPDESVDLDELRRGAFAEAVVLRLLAG